MARIEAWAADCAVEVTGAKSAVRRDTRDLGRRMRDFDLVFDDGHLEPLEVTLHADPAALQARSRFDRVGGGLEADVARVWVVSPPYLQTDVDGAAKAFDVNECRRLLPPIIERLERAGMTEFKDWQIAFDPEHAQDGRALAALGLRHGSSYAPTHPEDKPRILLMPSSGSVMNPDDVRRAVERAAGLTDNLQ
jgi:hypothetical protein